MSQIVSHNFFIRFLYFVFCFKVITVDARNHGDSPHTLEQSYPLMAEDVKFLMEDLGVEKASLIGHSMGGRAMMYLAVINVRFVLILIFLLIIQKHIKLHVG